LAVAFLSVIPEGNLLLSFARAATDATAGKPSVQDLLTLIISF
jgi:hypothetical protein